MAKEGNPLGWYLVQRNRFLFDVSYLAATVNDALVIRVGSCFLWPSGLSRFFIFYFFLDFAIEVVFLADADPRFECTAVVIFLVHLSSRERVQ